MGKELLRLAQSQARELDAKLVTATITSAECLASMTEVFGADSVTVAKHGDFGAPGSTRAKLEHYIEEPYL